MENPFLADNKNSPFQTPYQQPAPGAAPGIKPFAAVDLAPPVEPNGRHGAPAAPSPSPFAGNDFSTAFMTREPPLAGALSPAAPASAAPVSNPFSAAPATPTPAAPAPMSDYSPVSMAAPAAARQSQILSMSDFNDSLMAHKPEFFCTSTPGIDGYQIQRYLGVVSVELVIPKDVLFQHPAPHGELHRIKSAEDQLQKVKTKAFEELADRARALHADGVVGATLQFSQLDAVVCLCSAVGTAVKLAD